MTRSALRNIALMFVFTLGVTSLCCARPPERQQSKGAQQASQKASFVKFKRLSIVDKQGTGTEAFSCLMPADWQFAGGIRWVMDNPGMPAVAAFTLRNPRGREELEAFPNLSFFWTNNRMLLGTFPAGSRYFGSEVRPPVGPVEALKGIVLPRFRKDVTGLKIISGQRLPDLAKALGAGMQSGPGVTSTADAAKLRIEYQKAGVWMEEEIYGVVELVHFSMPSVYGTVTNTNWMVEHLFSFKAEKGKLDNSAKVFQTIAYSFRLNPKWFNTYTQVVENLIQMQIKQIRNIGEISRIISRTHNEISDKIMQAYNYRQAVNDRIAENFSQYARGVDGYYNPIEQRPVELPSGYTNAWTNSLGEYVVSESPAFNPNIGSNLTWHKMERK